MIWRHEDSVKDWWLKAVSGGGDHTKATTSLMMLVSWEIWKEHNARIFQNVSGPTSIVIAKIKEKAHLWTFGRSEAA